MLKFDYASLLNRNTLLVYDMLQDITPPIDPPRHKGWIEWWEDPDSEFEIPLDPLDTQDNMKDDSYHRRRWFWQEIKIDSEVRKAITVFYHTNLRYKNSNLQMKEIIFPCPVDNPTPILPPQRFKKRMTLLLDMDNTLVNWTRKEQFWYDTKIVYDGFESDISFYVSLRPYLIEFLQALQPKFELVLFTAGVKSYADKVIDSFDPNDEFFDYRLYRDSWHLKEQFYYKFLDNIGRPLWSTIIIDDKILSFSKNMDNGIPILDYNGDKHDVELKFLQEELLGIYQLLTTSLQKSNQDVRNILKKRYKLKQKLREVLTEPDLKYW